MKKITLNFIFISFFAALFSFRLVAQEALTVVAVGEAGDLKSKISIVGEGAAFNLAKIVANDFAFYKRLFEVIDTGEMVRSSFSKDLDIDFYSTKNLETIIQIEKGKSSDQAYVKIWDVKSKKINFTSPVIEAENSRTLAHRLATAAFIKLQNKTPMFESKIAFVSDIQGTRRDPIKELYIMDFDGFNLKQLTHHRGTVISPSFSHNGTKIVYSLIKNEVTRNRNIDLLIYDLESGRSSILSSLPGINSGAVFLTGDKELLLTLSKTGNAEIYKMDLGSKELFQITNHPAPDVDPSITPDGNLMVFLSGRPGRAEIYLGDPHKLESGIKRISYVGDFNASPRFSRDGREIVFSSWLGGVFDIFRINSGGTGLVRLTKDFGSNESPVFSPDGEFVAFTSQRVISRREAIQNVYIMDRDGEIIGPATQKMGNCSSPSWSK